MEISKLIEKFEPQLNRLGVKHRLTLKQQEEIIESFFRDLKMFITDPRMPKVRIQNFGTFRPAKGQISRSLKKSFWHRSVGNGSLSKLREKIAWLWPIRQRLLKEEEIKGPYKHNYVHFHQRSYHWDEVVLNGGAKKIFPSAYSDEEE